MARDTRPQAPRGGGSRPVPAAAGVSAAPAAVRDPRAGGRETVESIVVAFTLALLFRAFEAEAFVIPTGSMAPTLMGRHKDLACAGCGADFQLGCSAEEDDDAQRRRAELAAVDGAGGDPVRAAALRRALADKLVPRARCPNCGAIAELTQGDGGQRAYRREYPSFSGDRILVDKFAYDFREPARWDVVVFKYPEEAKTNYIKRLVGLPGETVTIAAGDIWTSRAGEPERIARKPADTLVAMLEPVHDSRRVAPQLVAAGWPTAWHDWGGPAAACRWTTDDEGRSFAAACAAGTSATLRWRHVVPMPDVWRDVEAGRPVAERAEPRLVGDFQPYNPESIGPHWVGDLAVEFDLESRSAGGRIEIDLVEAGEAHRCTIDLADGGVTIAPAGGAGPAARGRSGVRGRGSWRLLFANVDDDLSLFVDGRRVTFATPTTWRREAAAAQARPVVRGARPGSAEPDDLAPVGITAAAAAVTIGDLRVLRDLYYVASGTQAALVGREPEAALVAYPLEADQFFMLGDNSSASKDSRAWGTPEAPLHHVDRRLLIGRALLVFWPHAVPTAWNVKLAERCGWELRLPCLPNFARMRFVK